MIKLWVLCVIALPLSTLAQGEPWLYPEPDTQAETLYGTTLEDFLSALTPDAMPPRQMPPLILFEGLENISTDPNTILELRKRGLTPTVRLNAQSLPLLKAIQAAHAPVILTGRRSFHPPEKNIPYSLAGTPEDWAHTYPDFIKVPPKWKQTPCPTLEQGWQMESEHLRQQWQAIKDENIEVDALWLDYEGEPNTANHLACAMCWRCQDQIPHEVLQDEQTFLAWKRTRWIQLISNYYAKPFLDIFPEASMTNWSYVLSTQAHQPANWLGNPRPLSGTSHINTTNPVAYGTDFAYERLAKQHPPKNQSDIDRLYTQAILEQVFADAQNRKNINPAMRAAPWVAQWVIHTDNPEHPVMSQAAYRECLRHIWLSALAGMQVFNPRYKGYTHRAMLEVQDAIAVYKELFPYAQIIHQGTPAFYQWDTLHTTQPIIISALRHKNKLLVRTTNLSKEAQTVRLQWDDNHASTSILAPSGGHYHLMDIIDNQAYLNTTDHQSLDRKTNHTTIPEHSLTSDRLNQPSQ